MDTILEHIDPQVIFVIIALLVGGGQALLEKMRKVRAEREAQRELAERAADREARGDHGIPPTLPGSFEDLYDEYRKTILEDQRRPPGQPEHHEPPWHAPQEAAAPPPLPQHAPPPPPVHFDPVAEKSAQSAASAVQAWQTPVARRPDETLTAAEQAALAALRARQPARTAAVGRRPTKSVVGHKAYWRQAMMLREVLGPPKGLS